MDCSFRKKKRWLQLRLGALFRWRGSSKPTIGVSNHQHEISEVQQSNVKVGIVSFLELSVKRSKTAGSIKLLIMLKKSTQNCGINGLLTSGLSKNEVFNTPKPERLEKVVMRTDITGYWICEIMAGRPPVIDGLYLSSTVSVHSDSGSYSKINNGAKNIFRLKKIMCNNSYGFTNSLLVVLLWRKFRR